MPIYHQTTSSASAAPAKLARQVAVKPKAKKRKKAAAKKANAAGAPLFSRNVTERLDRLERAIQNVLGIDLADHEAGPPVSSPVGPPPAEDVS